MKLRLSSSVLAAHALLSSCSHSSGGSTVGETCGNYPSWSRDKAIQAGEIFLFNGTPYMASADSQGQSPLDQTTLWNAVPCDSSKVAALQSGAKPESWRMVWSDEFDGTALDESKWVYEVQKPGWVNNELQNYTDHRSENVRIEDGKLIIEGRRDNFEGLEYSSGRIKTSGKAGWKYGRMEARIQVPNGVGVWPAFWMMPEDMTRGWPACGEIDIMEQVGFEPNSIHASLHSLAYNWKNGKSLTSTLNISEATTDFHVYAVDWFPDHIDAFVDGRRYFTGYNEGKGDDAWPFDKNFYIILNLAIGGEWGAARGVDKTIWPRQMQVDYVRVYQK